MEEMSLRLVFSQTVVMKLVDDKRIDSPWTLASLSDDNIATICNVIFRLGEPNFYPGHEESPTTSIHVQDNGALFQGLQDLMHQQHICAAIPAPMGAGTEENRHCQGAQS